MPDHEGALWTAELGAGYAGPMPVAPDPFPIAALLREAVEAECIRTGATHKDIAGRCRNEQGRPMTEQQLSRALREGVEARGATIRAVCKALGLRVALAKEER